MYKIIYSRSTNVDSYLSFIDWFELFFSHRERVDQLEKTVANDNETIEYLLKSRNDAEHKCDVAKADYETLSETSNHEIMRLKAKLYDYMTKEEEKEA